METTAIIKWKQSRFVAEGNTEYIWCSTYSLYALQIEFM